MRRLNLVLIFIAIIIVVIITNMAFLQCEKNSTTLVQNAKDENEMLNIIGKFVLKKEDFSQNLEKFQESVQTYPAWYLHGYLGQREILSNDDKNYFTQEMELKDKSQVWANYIILKTPEDTMKVTHYRCACMSNVAHVLGYYNKECIGLTEYDHAYYYDEVTSYALVFQCKNIVVAIGVTSETQNKEKLMHTCQDYAKMIIQRINQSLKE